MSRIPLAIARYRAWAPGVESVDDWQRWARNELPIGDDGSPALQFLPSLFRRRLSRLSRMALQVAYDCAGNDHDVPTVFCSRHGELTRTVGLLLDQAQGEALSPTAFSMSVHNTASGLYSIASGNAAPSNAVAAMHDSLPTALVDAAATLAVGRASRVMVVVAEEPVAEPYRDFVPAESAFAAAFLLVADAQAADRDATRLTLTFAGNAAGDAARDQQGLALLRYLNGSDYTRPLVLGGERLRWMFAAA